MSESNRELSVEDVEFLQAVRHIEKNPDEYESVQRSSGRATTQALGKVLTEEWDTVSEWTDTMISYRMTKSTKSQPSRGWDEGGFGAVRLHDAELDPEVGWTSRSIELTETGVKMLSRREQQLNLARSEAGGGVNELDSKATDLELKFERMEEKIEELEAENQKLREKVNGVSEDVSRFKQSETGALGADASDQLKDVFQRMVVISRIHAQVLDIDTEPYKPPGEPEEVDIENTRRQLQATLLPDSE